MGKLKTIFVLCFSILLIFSCKKDKGENEYQYLIPELSTDGWEVASASEVGINVDALTDMMTYISNTSGHNIHSILIFKDAKLIFEEYFEGYLYSWDPPGSNGDSITYDKETDHYLASVSKTITSVIFGAAVKEGFIDDLDEKVLNIFPEQELIIVFNGGNYLDGGSISQFSLLENYILESIQ